MVKKKIAINMDLIDLYSSLLNEVWGKTSELIGETLLVFFILLIIKRTPDKASILREIRVSEDGISLETVRKQCQDASPDDVHRALQGLVKSLFNVFTVITENVINRELFSTVFPKLREAEKMVSQ